MIYLDSSLETQKGLLQAQVGQAEDMGNFQVAESLRSQIEAINTKISQNSAAIAREGFPLSPVSYVLSRRAIAND